MGKGGGASLAVRRARRDSQRSRRVGRRRSGALQGTRGRAPKDIAAVKDILARVGQMGGDCPAIQEVDLNPVIVHPKGATIVDARVILRPAG